MKITFKIPKEHKGGAGSGNFGHAGRPGKRGGSSPGGAGGTVYGTQYGGHKTTQAAFDKRYEVISSLQDQYGSMKIKPDRSVNGGMNRRYITRVPQSKLVQHILKAGFERDAANDNIFTHSSGVKFRISRKVGTYGSYYLYGDITTGD